MKDTEKERHYERERAWNMPVSARSRTTSNTSITGLPARPGLEQPKFTPDRVLRSRRPSSPSESVRSGATEDEENYEGERNSASPHSIRNHHHQRQRPASPLASPSLVNSRVRTQSALSKPNNADTRFGWQFPRNRPQLPDFESNITSPEHSPPPVHQSMARNAGSMKMSHIPVRSPDRVPKIEIKLNGDAKKFTKGHKRATTEFAEANGAIPPRIHLQLERESDLESASENFDAKSPLGMSYLFSVWL